MCACLCVCADGSGTSEREKGMRMTSKTKKNSLKTADVLWTEASNWLLNNRHRLDPVFSEILFNACYSKCNRFICEHSIRKLSTKYTYIIKLLVYAENWELVRASCFSSDFSEQFDKCQFLLWLQFRIKPSEIKSTLHWLQFQSN